MLSSVELSVIGAVAAALFAAAVVAFITTPVVRSLAFKICLLYTSDAADE